MSKLIPATLFAAGALLSATAGVAATTKTSAAVATHTTTTTTRPSLMARMKGVFARPAAAPAATTRGYTHTATTVAPGRMVTTKTSTGKTVTYNCSKAGNVTKKACK